MLPSRQREVYLRAIPDSGPLSLRGRNGVTEVIVQAPMGLRQTPQQFKQQDFVTLICLLLSSTVNMDYC